MSSNTDFPSDRRTDWRTPVHFGGLLTMGGVSAPCLVQNMCSRGFLIRAEKDLPVGHAVHLRCELYPGQFIECTVQVRHVNADCLGARVIDIGDEARRLCLRYLEERRAADGAAGAP